MGKPDKSRIPQTESDSEEEQQVKRPKNRKNKDKHRKDESDSGSSEEEESDSQGSKQQQSKIASMIAERIAKHRQQDAEQDFDVPEGVDRQKMEERYRWLMDQVGATGIPCKPHKKEVEHERFYIVGVSKSLKLHLFYQGKPKKDFSTPTEVLRPIYDDNGIETKSIKGWEQSSAFVKRKKSAATASWLAMSAVVPSDYRKRRVSAKNSTKKRKSEKQPAKSKPKSKAEDAADSDDEEESAPEPESEPEPVSPQTKKKKHKSSKRAREDEDPQQEDGPSKKKKKKKSSKKLKIQRAVDYARDMQAFVSLSEDTANQAGDTVLRATVARASLCGDMKTVLYLIKCLNEHMAEKMTDEVEPAKTSENGKEEDKAEDDGKTADEQTSEAQNDASEDKSVSTEAHQADASAGDVDMVDEKHQDGEIHDADDMI